MLKLCTWLPVLFLGIHIAFGQTCEPSPSGIIAWWPLDETGGTSIADIVGQKDGESKNGSNPIAGMIEGARHFDGTDDYISIPDNDLWAFGSNDFTIELWAIFDTPGGGSIGNPGDVFISHDEASGTRRKWFFALGGGFLYFHINGPGIGAKFFPQVSFSPVVGQWYHLAVTRENDTYKIFINGKVGGSATNTDNISNPDAPLTIGQSNEAFGGFMNGSLDEVTIYNRALSEDEMQGIYEAGADGKCKTIASGNEDQGKYRYWIPFVDTEHSGANNTYNSISIYAFMNCTQVSIGSQKFSLNAGEHLTIERPTLKEGLLIRSNNPLQIQYFFAASHYGRYEDGSLSYYVLEEKYLGNDYTVPIPNTEIAVLAIENDTQVKIGVSLPDFLNAGEVKKYPSIPIGTSISSNKPIAVVAIHYSSDFYSATFAEMIFPHKLIASEYYVPKQRPYSLRSPIDESGVYITSIADNTIVEVSGSTYPLNNGEFVFHPTTEEIIVRSNKPFYATYLNDTQGQDPWTFEIRHYQYAFSLSSPDIGVKHAIIDKAARSSHGFPGVQVSITSLGDDNEIKLFTNKNIQKTLPLNVGQTAYLNEGDIADWDAYPLVITAEKEFQINKSSWGWWNRISETTYAGNVFGAPDFIEEEEVDLKISVSGLTTFCEGDSVTLSVPQESSISFQWFQNSSPVGTDTSSIVVDESGAYSLQVTNQCGEIMHSDTVLVSVKPAPTPPFTKDSVSCGPGKVMLTASGTQDGNFRWYENDSIQNHIEGQVNAYFETPVLDTTTTYYVSIVEDGCESARTPVQAIVLDAPISSDDIEITPDGPTAFCEGGSVTLSVPSEISTSFQWFQDGNPIGSNSNLLTVSASGAYTVQFINSCGISELIKDTVQVTVNTIPSSPIIADTLLCGAGNATLQATGQAEVFKWYATANNQNVLHQSEDGIFVTPQLNTSTPFWVSAVNGDCESNRIMATVFVDLPSAQAGNDTTVQVGASVQLQASGGNGYQWSPPQWLNDNTIADPIATPLEDVTYTVAVTSHTGCIFEADIVITVIPILNDLFIPNTITPNGDGVNDTWIITNIEHYQENNVSIFDRTGRQLLEFTGYQQPWDGTVKGNPLPTDTYFYLIDIGNNNPPMKGSITIIR